MHFSEWLQAQMERLDLNYTQLSKLSGVDISLLSRYVSGEVKPKSKNIRRLSTALHLAYRESGEELSTLEITAQIVEVLDD
jgi:transcriptional regulator with XRE-family HTH domain